MGLLIKILAHYFRTELLKLRIFWNTYAWS